jgi:hypothetical protein
VVERRTQMIETLIGMLVLGGTGAGLYATYVKTRSFVRERLRFVDAAQRPSAPWIAGIGVSLVALPVFGGLLAFLPAVGGATALALGATVGAAVRSGQKQVKLLSGG